MRELETVLAEHPFCRDIDPSFVAALADCTWMVSFDAGKYVVREGDLADHFYLIVEGRVGMELHVPHLGNAVISTLSAGEVHGTHWLIPPYRWLFDYRAITPTRSVCIDGERLRIKCQDNPRLGHELMSRMASVLSRRLQMTRLQLIEALHDNA